MNLDRCKEIAAEVIGPDVHFVRDGGGCSIYRNEIELGRGGSWRDAMKEALRPYVVEHVQQFQEQHERQIIWRGLLYRLTMPFRWLFGLFRKSKPSAVLRLAK